MTKQLIAKTVEVRCKKCNKLLFKIYGKAKTNTIEVVGTDYYKTRLEGKSGGIEGKCSRCSEIGGITLKTLAEHFPESIQLTVVKTESL